MDFFLYAFQEGGAWEEVTVQIVEPNPCTNSKVTAVWIRNVCLEYPHGSARKRVKIGKKHQKHRCLTDVSCNTSSSSDMVSCLSSIHMIMHNQAAQSGRFSRHFFFPPPSNQFTLEKDKSLRSRIRGELEQMVIWTEKNKEQVKKNYQDGKRGSWGIAG